MDLALRAMILVIVRGMPTILEAHVPYASTYSIRRFHKPSCTLCTFLPLDRARLIILGLLQFMLEKIHGASTCATAACASAKEAHLSRPHRPAPLT